MPALSLEKAAERLVTEVKVAKPTTLAEVYAELFPECRPTIAVPAATELVAHIRSGLEAEEIVDLWNVVFPADWNVRYDEEDERLHFNEEVIGYAEAD